MEECRIAFSGHCDLDPTFSFHSYHNVRLSVRPYVPLRVRCISPKFFEVGIPNVMCGRILGWQCAVYHFWVTLTSDLVFRIIVSGAYLLCYLR